MRKLILNRFAGEQPPVKPDTSPSDSTHLKMNPDLFYPIGAMYKTTNASDPGEYLGGSWALRSSQYIDTGWQNFTWQNNTYAGNSQSDYTINQWRAKDGVLYIVCGAAATSLINTGSEDEIFRIPIKGVITGYTYNQVWCGAVGGGGAQGGFKLLQNANYLSVHIKPHTSANDMAASWYSTFFTIPIPDDAVITALTPAMTTDDVRMKKVYVWERVG